MATSKYLYPRTSKQIKTKQEEVSDASAGGFVRFLPRSTSKAEVQRRTRSGSTSPSAWALSPGRSSTFSSPVPKSPASYKKLMKQEEKGSGEGVSRVFRYFRQKKVSPLLEEEHNRLSIVCNRLLQWRFANARAESSMAAVCRVAQGNVWNRWVKISLMRKLVVEKRSEIQKVKQELKVYEILKSEMELLNEWWRIEKKNVEGVGRVVRKLSAISLSLPLLHNAQADIMSVYDAMTAAMEVMDSTKTMILDMDWQVERTCFVLTELGEMLKQQQQLFQELEKSLTLVALLQAEEKRLRIHHIQIVKEVNGTGTLSRTALN